MGRSRFAASLVLATGAVVAVFLPVSTADAAPPPSVTASPRVAPAGTRVSVKVAGCPGEMTVNVTGQAVGFRDTPALYLTRHATLPAPGRFSFSFPMPAEPATVSVGCTQGAIIQRAATITAPSTWAGRQTAVKRDADGSVLTVQTFEAGPPAAAFTLEGVPVPVVRSFTIAEGEKFRIAATVRGRVLLLAEEQIDGEDAGALQDSRPQAWLADLGPVEPVTPPTHQVTPPTTPSQSATPAPQPEANPSQPATAPPPGETLVLAATGTLGAGPATAAGAAAILFGGILIAWTRPAPGGRADCRRRRRGSPTR